jgi:glycosyltransferase involved in cell wall biosynthesis
MKILYTNFHPRNGGGHATYIVNLARCLQGEHQITVATPGTSRLYAQASRIPGVRCVDMNFSTRLGPMLAEVRRLRQLLREGRFDVVHVNGSADHRQLMLARIGLRRPPRIVWTKHNTMPVRSVGHWIRARFGTEGAIGVSDFVTRILLQSPYRRVPVRTVRHGVDTDRFHPWLVEAAAQARQALLGTLKPGTLVLASVGGTDRDKGWMTLAQALARLPVEARERVRLLVAGDPIQGGLLADFESLGVTACVIFPGLIPDPERILAAADVGFVLSLHEACSFAACESLAMGLPTLVSNAGGLPEVVRSGSDGWVVPAADVDVGHGWLLDRLSSGVDPAMGRAARARALECFSMPVFARQTLDFYRQVCV